jgi:4'-phosphopantetheinyl transferase
MPATGRLQRGLIVSTTRMANHRGRGRCLQLRIAAGIIPGWRSAIILIAAKTFAIGATGARTDVGSSIATPPPSLDVPALRDGEVHLWFFPLAVDEGQLVRHFPLLDEEERSRADRFRFENDRAAYIVSHATMRLLLARHRRCAPASIDIVQAVGEKPVLRGGEGPHFSLSHSGGTGLIGIADDELGVDVETLRSLSDRDAIARRFFAAAEVKALAGLAEPERQDAFFACWTRKEAYVKAIGLGLAAPLDAFEVSVDPTSAALLSVERDSQEATAWSLWSGRTDEAWAAAAIRRRDPRFCVFQIKPGPVTGGL